MKVAKNPAVDPTLPKLELVLDGVHHFLCFTFAALAAAEQKLREQGIVANLIHALDLSNLDATRVVPLLYAALITHDPGILIEDVVSLVTLRNLGAIFEAIAKAYSESLAEPEKTPVPLDNPVSS